MRVAGPHVTRQVHLLERRGLVRRLADEHDRRARPIALTPEGAATAERYLSAVLGRLDEALRDWSAEDRSTLLPAARALRRRPGRALHGERL